VSGSFDGILVYLTIRKIVDLWRIVTINWSCSQRGVVVNFQHLSKKRVEWTQTGFQIFFKKLLFPLFSKSREQHHFFNVASIPLLQPTIIIIGSRELTLLLFYDPDVPWMDFIRRCIRTLDWARIAYISLLRGVEIYRFLQPSQEGIRCFSPWWDLYQGSLFSFQWFECIFQWWPDGEPTGSVVVL